MQANIIHPVQYSINIYRNCSKEDKNKYIGLIYLSFLSKTPRVSEGSIFSKKLLGENNNSSQCLYYVLLFELLKHNSVKKEINYKRFVSLKPRCRRDLERLREIGFLSNDISIAIDASKELVNRYPRDAGLRLELYKIMLCFEEEGADILPEKIDKLRKSRLKIKDREFIRSVRTSNTRLRKEWIRSYGINNTFKRSKEMRGYIPFQYWSQGNQPSEIVELRNQWNKIFAELGIRPIVVYDKESARKWMQENCNELLPAFESAYLYAIEADIFRIAFAAKNDCIWLDSDLAPIGRNTISALANILTKNDTTLYFLWYKPLICNAFFATKAGSPFFEKFIVEHKDLEFTKNEKLYRGDIFGPEAYTNAVSNMKIRGNDVEKEKEDARKWKYGYCNEYNSIAMGPRYKLNYKFGTGAWQNVMGESNWKDITGKIDK